MSAEITRHMWRMGLMLATFTVAGVGLVALTYSGTQQAIAEQERLALARSLAALIPRDRYDNDLASDTRQVTEPAALGSKTPLTVYRARRAGQPTALILNAVAPDGYSGAIKLLIALNYDGSIIGVRVIEHKETPGLGDYIDSTRSDWIHGFIGRALGNPPESGWQVKKDGGIFDQNTGATITPRAVVKAVKKCLQYYAQNRDSLFAM